MGRILSGWKVYLRYTQLGVGYSDSSAHWTVISTWGQAETVKNRLDLKQIQFTQPRRVSKRKAVNMFHVTKNGLKKLHFTAKKETTQQETNSPVRTTKDHCMNSQRSAKMSQSYCTMAQQMKGRSEEFLPLKRMVQFSINFNGYMF